ncbi:MAG: hypothetical protein AB7O96_13065, partial [Pseudobdellovibrionaceae bacterium]
LGGLVLLLSFAKVNVAQAWGERGHHALCSAATKLEKQKDLIDFFKTKNHMMGHVCNIPDIHWRQLGDLSESGENTHFMNFENLDYTAENTPVKWEQIMAEKQGKMSKKLGKVINVSEDLGSSWWRFEQFYQRAVAAGAAAQKVQDKIDFRNKEDTNRKEFNKQIFAMLTNMGLIGHFVGDAAQPFHNTVDYDGWDTQQGGIHSFYESKVVVALGLGLEEKILSRAKEIKTEIEEGIHSNPFDPIAAIRFVTLRGLKEIGDIRRIDQTNIKSPSEKDETVRPPKKKNAIRGQPEIVAEALATPIVNELAAAALTLARSWDAIYVEAKMPKFMNYNSYNYPLSPDFVPPNYTKREPSSTKKKKSKGTWMERNHSCDEHSEPTH